MGFWRQQQEKLALRFLIWQYQKQKIAVPPIPTLKRQAAQVVDEAHRIAAQRGGNVMTIIKSMMTDLREK
ncbi:MAG: hypothetical protein QNI95_10680 [Desulfobacterales bacterium]|nr:hypothetical protein [Desulfobacterales bacterium]